MQSELDLAAIGHSQWQLNKASMALEKYTAELNGLYHELELVRQNERADINARIDYHANKAAEAKQNWAKDMVRAWRDSKRQPQMPYMGDVVGMGLNFLNAMSR